MLSVQIGAVQRLPALVFLGNKISDTQNERITQHRKMSIHIALIPKRATLIPEIVLLVFMWYNANAFRKYREKTIGSSLLQK